MTLLAVHVFWLFGFSIYTNGARIELLGTELSLQWRHSKYITPYVHFEAWGRHRYILNAAGSRWYSGDGNRPPTWAVRPEWRARRAS